MIDVKVVKRFTLNGTIDNHDPIGAIFRVTGGDKPFRLCVISVNWGRGYDPGEFKRNVLQVMDCVDEMTYVVLLIQELDEADSAPEHKITRQVIAGAWEPGSTYVEWWTREPIVVSPDAKVRRERRVMTMDQGNKIGAPDGTGPRRFFTSCVIVINGVIIGVGNQHPHRNLPNARVQAARRGGERVTRVEVAGLVRLCDLTVYGGDMNDTHYPRVHSREKTANERGLDTIRYVVG